MRHNGTRIFVLASLLFATVFVGKAKGQAEPQYHVVFGVRLDGLIDGVRWQVWNIGDPHLKSLLTASPPSVAAIMVERLVPPEEGVYRVYICARGASLLTKHDVPEADYQLLWKVATDTDALAAAIIGLRSVITEEDESLRNEGVAKLTQAIEGIEDPTRRKGAKLLAGAVISESEPSESILAEAKLGRFVADYRDHVASSTVEALTKSGSTTHLQPGVPYVVPQRGKKPLTTYEFLGNKPAGVTNHPVGNRNFTTAWINGNLVVTETPDKPPGENKFGPGRELIMVPTWRHGEELGLGRLDDSLPVLEWKDGKLKGTM
jgi:hypothetical protein